jgi:PIN domain nuclease of toxin-antitoxin system
VATAVLDTSVVLAAIQAEPGGDLAASMMPAALLSSVNLAEVATKLTKDGLSRSEVDEVVGALECEVVPFDRATAIEAGLLRAATHRIGLSLGDRSCLALAAARGLPVYTADRDWATLDLGIDIRLIR